MAFAKAFAAARKAGKKVFTYNGKSYNTKLAADTPKKGPIPSARPGSSVGKGRPASAPAPKPKAKSTPTAMPTSTFSKMKAGMDKLKPKSPGVIRGNYKRK